MATTSTDAPARRPRRSRRPAVVPTVLTEPWAISRPGMELVLWVWSGGELFPETGQRALDEHDGDTLDNKRTAYEVRDGIAVIPIHGTMVRHGGFVSNVSGCLSYESIRADLNAALADNSVRAVLFDIDSPGGEANGCRELASAIYAARGGKPLWAYVGGNGCSAAYWIASACDRIIAEDTAWLGSIGVISGLVDTTGAQEKSGRKELLIVSSQSPGKRSIPVDDEVIARATARATATAAIFIEDVARNRGVTDEYVIENFGTGDAVIGRAAVEVGLADELGDLEQAIAALAAQLDSPAPQAAPATNPARPTRTDPTTGGASMNRTAARAASATSKTATPKAKAATGAARAEDDKDKDKDKPAATEMVECESCKGDGEMDDGTKCETCGGSGKVAKEKAEADEPGAADDAEPGAAEDGGDNKEKKAHAALAQMAGLPATARLASIHRTLAARTAPLAKVAELEGQLAELQGRFEAREAETQEAEADAFVERAIAEQRTTEDKAEVIKATYLEDGAAAAEKQLYPKGTFGALKTYSNGGAVGGKKRGGGPGKDPGSAVRAQAPTTTGGRFGIPVRGAALDVAAKERMKAKPALDYAAACKEVLAEEPDLLQQ